MERGKKSFYTLRENGTPVDAPLRSLAVARRRAVAAERSGAKVTIEVSRETAARLIEQGEAEADRTGHWLRATTNDARRPLVVSGAP